MINRRLLLLLLSVTFSGAASAWGWDPVGDIQNPGRIFDNVAREVNNGAKAAGGPVGEVIVTPITAPLQLLGGCVQDLRTCPDAALKATPLPDLIQACTRDVAKCPEYVLKSAPAQLVWPIINAYEQRLQSQANGRWQRLPPGFVKTFASKYPQVNLNEVRFATGIDTVHGQAITLGNLIYFPKNVDLHLKTDRKWMLHELEHTVQYKLKGGEGAFLTEYLLHGAGTIVSCKCINVHDDIGIEQAATRKADIVGNEYGNVFYMTNSCERDLVFTTQVYDVSRAKWQIISYTLRAGKDTYLMNDGGDYLHTIGDTYYWYAETADGASRWEAPDARYSWEHQGVMRKFFEQKESPNAQRFGMNIVC